MFYEREIIKTRVRLIRPNSKKGKGRKRCVIEKINYHCFAHYLLIISLFIYAHYILSPRDQKFSKLGDKKRR